MLVTIFHLEIVWGKDLEIDRNWMILFPKLYLQESLNLKVPQACENKKEKKSNSHAFSTSGDR